MSSRFLDQLVPQSTASFRFRPPLIEPDVRLSRIRLSDKTSRVRPREAASKHLEIDKTQRVMQVTVGVACVPPTTLSVLLTQPSTEP